MGEFWDRAANYYRNPERGGQFPTYTPLRAALSLDTHYFFDPSEHMELMRGKPFLVIIGEEALSAHFSEVALNKAEGDAELYKIPKAHFDLYDQPQYVPVAVEKLDEFYSKTLQPKAKQVASFN